MKVKETRAVLDRIAYDGLGLSMEWEPGEDDRVLFEVRGIQLHRMLARAYCAGLAEGLAGQRMVKAQEPPGELLHALERPRSEDPG